MNHIASIGFALMAASMAAMSASLNFIDGTNVVIRATNNGPVISVQINAASTGGAPTISDQIQFTEAFSRVLIQSGGGQDTLDMEAADGSGTTNRFARFAYDYLEEGNTYTELFGQVRLQDAAATADYVWTCTNANGSGTWRALSLGNAVTNLTGTITTPDVIFDLGTPSGNTSMEWHNNMGRLFAVTNGALEGGLVLNGTLRLPNGGLGTNGQVLVSLGSGLAWQSIVPVIGATNILDSTGSSGTTGHYLRKSATGTYWGDGETNFANLNVTNFSAETMMIDTNLSTNTITTRLTVSETLTTPQVRYSLAVSNVHSGAVTNLAVNADCGRVMIYATNGLTLTNFVGLEAGEGLTAKYVDMTLIGCSNAMPLVTLPTLGGSSYGIRIFTNDSKPIITLLTNGVRVRYSWEFTGTNATLINCATF